MLMTALPTDLPAALTCHGSRQGPERRRASTLPRRAMGLKGKRSLGALPVESLGRRCGQRSSRGLRPYGSVASQLPSRRSSATPVMTPSSISSACMLPKYSGVGRVSTIS